MANKFKWQTRKDGPTDAQYISSYIVSKESSPDYVVWVEHGDDRRKWIFRIRERKSGGKVWTSKGRGWKSPATAKKKAILALYSIQGKIYLEKLKQTVSKNLVNGVDGVVLIKKDGQNVEMNLQEYCHKKAIEMNKSAAIQDKVTPEWVEEQIRGIAEKGTPPDFIGWKIEDDLAINETEEITATT